MLSKGISYQLFHLKSITHTYYHLKSREGAQKRNNITWKNHRFTYMYGKNSEMAMERDKEADKLNQFNKNREPPFVAFHALLAADEGF